MLKVPNLVMGGDMSFTMNHKEVWGANARLDHLADYFLNTFEPAELVDIEPLQLKPTCCNNKMGDKGVSKRLDRSLLHQDLLQMICRYRSWVGPLCCSNHFPIFLELDHDKPKSG